MAKLILPLFGLPVQMKCSCAYHPALVALKGGKGTFEAKQMLLKILFLHCYIPVIYTILIHFHCPYMLAFFAFI